MTDVEPGSISPDVVPTSAARIMPLPNKALRRRVKVLSRDYEIIVRRQTRKCGYRTDSIGPRPFDSFRRAIERQFLPHYFGDPPAWRLALRGLFKRRTLPDFCFIGPIKAGTSDIAMTLLLHPCIMTPLSKEIWPKEFHRITAYYPTFREKKARASKCGTALSPYLMPALHLLNFAHDLAAVMPRKKVIITLRNPVWRMYSHWKWEILAAGSQRLSDMPFMHTFDAYVDKSLDLYPTMPMYTACGWEGLRSSIYWHAVKCWQDLFGRANVLVVESDEYFRDKTDFMYKMQDFLGLPRTALPGSPRTVNENPLKLPAPGADSIDKLRNFFRPHNDKLWEIIGRRFDW